jgi:hypothetical protein
MPAIPTREAKSWRMEVQHQFREKGSISINI